MNTAFDLGFEKQAGLPIASVPKALGRIGAHLAGSGIAAAGKGITGVGRGLGELYERTGDISRGIPVIGERMGSVADKVGHAYRLMLGGIGGRVESAGSRLRDIGGFGRGRNTPLARGKQQAFIGPPTGYTPSDVGDY